MSAPRPVSDRDVADFAEEHGCSMLEARQELELEPEPRNPGQQRPCPTGHQWAYTGTEYGGDDESYHGEGRCYCVHCGADGDA